MKIWLKLLKNWGEHKEGDIVQFDEDKGRRRIAEDIAIEVKDTELKKIRSKAETAMVNINAETAEVTPVIEPKKAETAEVTPEVEPKKSGRHSKKGGE